MALYRGLPGYAGNRKTFIHSHASCSSDIPYQLPPSTTIYSILLIQFTCLTVLCHNLSPGSLWSSSWSGALYLIFHAFLHPVIIFFSQHMPIPSADTHTHPFNGPLSRTSRVSWYQKGKTNLDFNGARDSEWQWNPLGHMQVCTSLQTDNHASTPPLGFLQAGALPAAQPTASKH